MRLRIASIALVATALAVLAQPASAVVYITINVPVDVDNLDPSITSVWCPCWLKGPGSGTLSGPTLSPAATSTTGTVTRGSFHGTLTATLGDTTTSLDNFLRAASVECMLTLNSSTGLSYQPGSSTIPYTTGPAAPKPGTRFRAKIEIPLR